MMNKLLESQINALMQECHDNQVPCITGATRELLMHYITARKPHTYLEIGTAWGVSLLTAHQLMSQRGGSVVGIERSLPNVHRVQHTIEHHQLTDIALFHLNANHPGREGDVITKPIEFAFIDARKANYHIYLQTILPSMAQNSVIICDDVIEFANKLVPLYQFLDENQMNYETRTLHDGDGVLIITL